MDNRSSDIEVADLTRSFANLVAVDHLSFSVERGEIFGLVGPDGAGKTTTMRMLTGILPPDSGAITVAGCDVVADPEAVKSRISYMPQRFGLYEDLTVDENIRFYADVFEVKRKAREERAAPLLAACGMSQFRARLAGNLSGGMKQKLGLVCALIHTPRVLLLDEPTNGVDPISRREFWAMLYSLLDQGVTILSSTAYLDEAERCHRLALLHNGRLLFCDEPESLKDRFPGAVLSIVSPEGRRLRDELRHAQGVTGTVLVGDAIHLFVDDGARRLQELRKRLDTERVEYSEITEVRPTIEDLFVSATAEQEAA
ncbi:MAG TPA: ABC transporter ATP-binding protein [Candidatus Binataceae bacterium]|nr:ABC transporter ATP-binding protein [Candidatus Binataceae bacterium]